jgi:antitoxin YefM
MIKWYSVPVQEADMPEMTYTFARAHLAQLCDQVVDDREAIIIKRRNGRDVALVAAEELSAMEETLHLLSSPENARRLLEALERAGRNEGDSETVEELRRETLGGVAQSA